MTFIIYASVLISDEKNNILLVTEKKEVNYNKLNLPGGHLELWESPMEWAIREVFEETCVGVELTGLIGIYLGRNKPSFHYIFTGKILQGTPQWNPNEVIKAEWYSIDELVNLPKDSFVYREKLDDVLKKYQSGEIMTIESVIFDLKKI